MRRRIVIALFVLAALAAGAVALVLINKPGNVSNPDVAFEDETATPTPTPRAKKGERKPKPEFVWPMYGFGPDRRRQVDVPNDFGPPFKRLWHYSAGVLIEFPPVVSAKSLFVLRDDGVAVSIDKETGNERWKTKLGDLSASTPYLDMEAERLYLTLLENNQGGPGRAVAISTKSGNTHWSVELPSRSESSPIVDDGVMYFGSEDGTVYALRAKDGKQLWTYQASGEVKGALALKDGRLFFGDYAGKVYAIRAKDGREVWEASTQGASFGFASGRFYSSPAVAYGRVFLGNVDGFVYAFSEDTGELAWRTETSGYVYASPAVGAPPGGEPTVYIGSYDGTFYALDARTGGVRWSYASGGGISGSATLLDNVVYFSTRDTRVTVGLNARTGAKVFDYPKGAYANVVTDLEKLYLVGWGGIYGMRPRGASAAAGERRKRSARSGRPRSNTRRSGRSKPRERRRRPR